MTNLIRPAYRLGTSMFEQKNVKLPPNIRNGIGNYTITRRNFDASVISPRIAGDFDRLQALDIETQGAKVQLSDKTIEELFKMKIPDKKDTTWIAEKNRLVVDYAARGMTPEQIQQELEINKPLGREQRKIKSSQNFAESSLSVGDKIEEIKNQVVDGRVESRAQQVALVAQIALLLADTRAIEALTRVQLGDLARTIATLRLPTDHKLLGIPPRFIDIDFYNANAGLINLYLFSSVQADPNYNGGAGPLTYDTLVYNFAGGPTGIPPVKLTSMVASMGRGGGRRYLDLLTRGVITQMQMRVAVAGLPGGFANPDVAISPANQ
mgnify:CR=1 FL=1